MKARKASRRTELKILRRRWQVGASPSSRWMLCNTGKHCADAVILHFWQRSPRSMSWTLRPGTIRVGRGAAVGLRDESGADLLVFAAYTDTEGKPQIARVDTREFFFDRHQHPRLFRLCAYYLFLLRSVPVSRQYLRGLRTSI